MSETRREIPLDTTRLDPSCPSCGARYNAEQRIKELEAELMSVSDGAAMTDMHKDKRIAELEDQVKFLQWMESFDSGFRSTTLMAQEEYEAMGEQE